MRRIMSKLNKDINFREKNKILSRAPSSQIHVNKIHLLSVYIQFNWMDKVLKNGRRQLFWGFFTFNFRF